MTTGPGRGTATTAALLAAAALAQSAPAAGQQGEAPADGAPAAGERPAADPGDVESIDGIVAALYDVISGAKGEARDWDRFRSLMYPGAVLLPNYPEQSGGARPLSVEEFVESATASVEEQGFYEDEVARTVQRYGPVANVFSTYVTRAPPTPSPSCGGSTRSSSSTTAGGGGWRTSRGRTRAKPGRSPTATGAVADASGRVRIRSPARRIGHRGSPHVEASRAGPAGRVRFPRSQMSRRPVPPGAEEGRRHRSVSGHRVHLRPVA